MQVHAEERWIACGGPAAICAQNLVAIVMNRHAEHARRINALRLKYHRRCPRERKFVAEGEAVGSVLVGSIPQLDESQLLTVDVAPQSNGSNSVHLLPRSCLVRPTLSLQRE